MKRLSLIAWISVSLLTLASCANPPSRPGLAKGGPGVGEGPGIPNRPGPGGLPPVGPVPVGNNGNTPNMVAASLKCDDPNTFKGLRAWRRLSNIELKNTVQDVFGVSGIDFSQIPDDLPKKEAFDTIQVEQNFISETRWNGLEAMAKSLTSKVDLAKVFPCLKEGPSCISKTLPGLLSLAWRRPATEAEVKELTDLYIALGKQDDYLADQAAKFIIQAIVLSHNFLYRSELGAMQGDKSFLLTDWEMASALSYTLWRHPPNEELRKMAMNGELSKDGAIRAQATKMMDAPQAKEAWKDFAAQWLDTIRIGISGKTDPMFNQMVKDKLVEEVRDTVTNFMFDAPEKTYKAMLTSDYTVADPALDFIYGSKSAAGKTMYPQSDRRGLLGQAGFLASHATPDDPNPILRGVFVAERLLCVHFVNPPPTTPPAKKPGLSNAELFRTHNNPACASCHSLIDNLGFPFEAFDTLGKYRTTDAGKPIDTSGMLPLDGKTIPLKGPADMINAIATSTQGQVCFVRQAFDYAFGRTEFYPRPMPDANKKTEPTAQGKFDQCQIDNAAGKMMEKGGDLKTAIIELISSPAFRNRLRGEVEKIDYKP